MRSSVWRHGRRADAAAEPDAEAAQEKKRAGLLDVLAMAARLFEANLQAPDGAKARGYLSDRGLGSAVQQRFSLGYSSPERFALRDALAAQGVGVEQMIEAGLLIHGEGIAVPYDRFRDRVMFPIHDRSGRVSPSAAGRWSRARRRNTSIRRRRRSSTKARCSSTTIGRERPRTTAARSSSSRAMSTRSR